MFHNTLLHALETGNIDIIENLINQDTDIAKIRRDALHIAVQHYQIQMIQFLLIQCKVDVNNLNILHQSALYLACEKWEQRHKQHLPCEQLEMIIVVMFNSFQANLKGFDEKAFSVLFYILKKQTRDEFISVDLSNRALGDKEIEALAIVLGNNHFISTLNLARNLFSQEAVINLEHAFQKNKTIRSLDLSHNQIGNTWIFFSGIQCFTVGVLYENMELRHLNISHCDLDKSDVQTLLEFIKESRGYYFHIKHIELTVSDKVFESLSKEEQNLVRATQRLAEYLNIIKKCQDRWLNSTYKTDEEEKLFQACWKYLERCELMYPAEDDHDKQQIIPCLDGVARGLIEFFNQAEADKKFKGFNSFIQDVFQILELERNSFLNKFDHQNQHFNKPKDIFYTHFENNMNALHTVSMSIHTTYVKNQIKTPVEEYAKLATSIISEWVTGMKVIEAASAVIHVVGEKYLSATIEGLHHLTLHDPICHYGFDYFKEKIIKKLYGLTENEKCRNLMFSFKNKRGEESKITAIAHAIMHHYRDSIESLPPEEEKIIAVIIAKYAYLHIAQLLMSGILLESEQKLTSAILIEDIILWLSYVPLQENGLRVNIMTDKEKMIAQEFFMQANIKFQDEAVCTVSTYNINTRRFAQQSGKTSRWATQTETDLVNYVLQDSSLEANTHTNNKIMGVTKTIIQQTIFFNKEELVQLKNKKYVETELSSYQSQRKTLNSHGVMLSKLSEKVQHLENNSYQKDKIIQEQNNQIINLQNKQKVLKEKINKWESKTEVNQIKRRLSL